MCVKLWKNTIKENKYTDMIIGFLNHLKATEQILLSSLDCWRLGFYGCFFYYKLQRRVFFIKLWAELAKSGVDQI